MSTPTCSTSCFVGFAVVISHLDLYLDHMKSCYDHIPRKQENIPSMCCLGKQVITKQCGSKCKGVNTVVTKLTSAAAAPVSFSDFSVKTEASRCRSDGPALEQYLLPLLQQVALSILAGEGLLFLPAFSLLNPRFYPTTRFRMCFQAIFKAAGTVGERPKLSYGR